jgi:hypothetical protein
MAQDSVPLVLVLVKALPLTVARLVLESLQLVMEQNPDCTRDLHPVTALVLLAPELDMALQLQVLVVVMEYAL